MQKWGCGAQGDELTKIGKSVFISKYRQSRQTNLDSEPDHLWWHFEVESQSLHLPEVVTLARTYTEVACKDRMCQKYFMKKIRASDTEPH